MITLPTEPKIIKLEGAIGVFEIENLHPGYGITLGNVLRRVLLSSLHGAAVTMVKIKGANHEFSTVPGVVEDVIEICLNIKRLRLKIHSDEPQKIYLKVKGQKEAKAKDIEIPSQIEIANPDLHIAELTTKNAELEMEMTVEKGMHYVTAEQRKHEKLEIGAIALDAIFTPIRKVNFEVENMRVGDRIDYNKLRIHIESDGTIDPLEALNEAAGILTEQFRQISGEKKEAEDMKKSLIKEKEKKEKNKKEKDKKEENNTLKTKISDLDVSSRIITALENNGIKSIESLVKKSEKDVIVMEGLAEKAVEDIQKALKKMTLALREEE